MININLYINIKIIHLYMPLMVLIFYLSLHQKLNTEWSKSKLFETLL